MNTNEETLKKIAKCRGGENYEDAVKVATKRLERKWDTTTFHPLFLGANVPIIENEP